MGSKTKGGWYCVGIHRDVNGDICGVKKSHVFKYEPCEVDDKTSPIVRRKEWFFKSEDECRRKCELLTKEVCKNMVRHGFVEFSKYFASRAHESDTMLTVGDLVKFLKKQDQDALVVGFCGNSGAYISQLKEIPNDSVTTVGDLKARDRKRLKGRLRENDWWRKMFRYVKDEDVIIQFY